MSEQSALRVEYRESVTIAWADIRPPAGKDLDLDRAANHIRYAWCRLAPEMERGSRFLWDLVSPEETQIRLGDRPPPFSHTTLRDIEDEAWDDFRGQVGDALVCMASLNTELTHSQFFRVWRDLVDRLESPVDNDPDPLEDADDN